MRRIIALHTAQSIPGGSKPWVRARRASLALLPQRPRHNERHTGEVIACESPQTNGICDRFHKTALNEFYRVAFRKKVYRSIDELQADLDLWIREYNEQRPHQGRWCFGKAPMQTFLDAMPMAKEKMIAA
jgi:transposase InsO family protein